MTVGRTMGWTMGWTMARGRLALFGAALPGLAVVLASAMLLGLAGCQAEDRSASVMRGAGQQAGSGGGSAAGTVAGKETGEPEPAPALAGRQQATAARAPEGAATPAEPVLGQPVETPESAAKKAKRHPPPPGVRDLGWEDLIPKDWNPRAVLDRLGIDALADDDPRVDAVLAQIRADWDRAPVVAALDGQKVRLPGYVVMLNGNRSGVSEFLLVPYFGACIHLPPPPASQVVHVLPARTVPEAVAMFPVWVTGTLKTVQADTAMGAAGYRMAGAVVEPYPWDR
jgi:hypothetical protein